MATTDDYKITEEEAFCFLRDVLQIESAETKLQANKVTFLDEFIKAMEHHIPYQTITGIATPEGNRRLPTAADIKTDIISKVGGLCYQIQIFCWMLLRALEFDVHLAPGDGFHKKNIHVGVVLNGLTYQGSKHLLEVGLGHPTFQLIPLNFEHSSPEYCDSYMRYRYVHQGEGTIIFQPSADTVPLVACQFPEFINDGWFSFISIHTDQSVGVSHFDGAMMNIFIVDTEEYFLASLRCVAYPNGRLVCIKDSKLRLEDEARQMQVSHFRSNNEFIEAFARYFPQFPEDMIKAAMENIQFKLP